MAGSLVDKTWLSSGTDQALTDAIKKGIASAGMPAFGSVLTDEEVRTLVVYIREAGAKAAQQQTPESEFGKALKPNTTLYRLKKCYPLMALYGLLTSYLTIACSTRFVRVSFGI